jgi:hypothetical protein
MMNETGRGVQHDLSAMTDNELSELVEAIRAEQRRRWPKKSAGRIEVVNMAEVEP